ncbi:MAG: phenylalanine--tRNA ligase subunit alpha, partial [Myxococcales bacterium]|nr:phenylalanine--tRNA ligase subunit alpha [Myxococcales bacterium]
MSDVRPEADKSAVSRIQERLDALGTSFEQAFAAAKTEHELRAEQAKLLGKKGDLTAVLALMRDVPADQRPAAGALVNAFKAGVEKRFDECLAALGNAALRAELEARPFDLTLPGRLSLGRGHPHPVLQVRDELLAIFRDLGFQSVEGPEIELEANNFTKLAFPPDHPATDMQDSFWFGPGLLLRTHTSNVQVREMS